METIAISKFKATCLAILDRVKKTGEPVLVTKMGTPIAQVIPPPLEETSGMDSYGCMAHRTKILGDLIEPLPPSDWGIPE